MAHVKDPGPSSGSHSILDMGTRAWIAWRYKNKYYRQFVRFDAYPDRIGKYMARLIPRDSRKREAWIQHIIKGLEAGVEYRRHENIQDDKEYRYRHNPGNSSRFRDGEPVFSDISKTNIWITGECNDVTYTYVMDLDYRAFTVNGEIHFSFDNMPPRNPGIAAYFRDEGPVIPPEYLTTVSYWPDPEYDAGLVVNEYDECAPRVTSLEEWGVPGWESLPVSQHLSTELVKSVVSDFQKILCTPDLRIHYGRIILICWRVLCAAAPSHNLCPARTTHLSENLLFASTQFKEYDHNGRVIRYRINMDVHQILRPYCWFRGCLIKFFTRLDDDLYLKHEVVRKATRLRAKDRKNGVGILVSSYQIVAVAVEGSEVRHSPALDFHDNRGGVRDGLLLLMHLLSPVTTVHKTPWTPTTSSCSTSPILPEEVIQNVLRYTDDDTYHFVLPLVSRLVRTMCLAHPRVGDFILSSYNSDGTYQVLSTLESTDEARVRLVRSGEEQKEALLCSFQHHQAGLGRDKEAFEARWKGVRWNEWMSVRVSWGALMQGTVVPAMRVQVVEGTWGLERVEGAVEDSTAM